MAILRSDPVTFLTGDHSKTDRPSAISEVGGGGKFTASGEVLRFPGFTFLCHVDRDGPAFDALRDLQDALKRSEYAGFFTYLPPESFHMTIFQGITGEPADPDEWPVGVPRNTDHEAVLRILLDRLEGIVVPKSRRVRPKGVFGGFSVLLAGADEAEEASLRETRETLSRATGIRRPDFETYTFHLTLAYPLQWLEEGVAREVTALSDRLFERFSSAVPEIALGPVEFCRFEDMHRFDPIKAL